MKQFIIACTIDGKEEYRGDCRMCATIILCAKIIDTQTTNPILDSLSFYLRQQQTIVITLRSADIICICGNCRNAYYHTTE